MLLPFFVALLFQSLNCQALDPKTVFDANGISLYEKIEEIERQLLNPFTLNSLVTPCHEDFGLDQPGFNDTDTVGEQTSAEWVRIVFHDSITHGIAGPGLGGLDASISFESEHLPENLGVFINTTIGQFSQFSSVFLSMADLIGVGLSDSLATCDPDSRRLPLRVGRIDAIKPGPSGVPKPTDSYDFALAAFATAGFSQQDMIQAVACGHSLGGVHHSNFADIATNPLPSGGTDGRVPFDSTPAIFDNVVVQEYLTGKGQAGGPLVTGPNATNSDLRIYKSDHNQTIIAMSIPQSFEDTCFTIFEKMINTVPTAVTLSDPLLPRPWILRTGSLDLNTAGAVTFSGTIIGHGLPSLPQQASYFYGTVGGGNTGQKLSLAGSTYPILFKTPIGFGNITDYAFNDTLTSAQITSINVENNYTAPINPNIFVLPSQSYHNAIQTSGVTTGSQFVVRAAILTTLASSTPLSLKMWYPQAQSGSLAPRIFNQTIATTFKVKLGAYSIYQAVVQTGNVTGGSTVFQALLGSTQISAKVKADTWLGCTDSPLTACY